jgi:haloacetate dehalogenase
MTDLFPGFRSAMIEGAGATIHCRIGGEGPPLLLLHGFPQTGETWHRVAAGFAAEFTVVIPDLRGYGQSTAPTSDDTHDAYSKRSMGHDFAAVMSALGHQRFAVLGHDRGARVAYRMALDMPERISRVGIIEVVPTAEMWRAFDAEMAMGAYHWTFLAQPSPLPERMIGADPRAYLEWTLASWTRRKSLDVFDARALDAYRRTFAEPARIHAVCEDYRAGATIDRARDEADHAAGRRVTQPLHFLWSDHGFPARTGDPLGLWRSWADDVTGNEVIAGHFVPEENPKGVLDAFLPFFRG